jgi:putative membrane-bound dehydrogenase-like protein
VGFRRLILILAISELAPHGALAQKDQGFDNTKPSGQPYLSPEESLSRLRVPPGFEVKLFAAEPDIINPIAFTVDERGRLWVVECYEYPKRTPPGKKPRDRIKILEDTTGSGKADKVITWVEGTDLPTGFDLATGIEVGDGGVYLGAAPYLFFLRDTRGRGRCDEQKILLSGFGSQDTHETLNTLQWGPDGALYGLHGIFTRSRVGEVRLNAAVWRYQTESRKFDVFAEGTSNPWGLDFDAHGQAFLTACVIPHAFHIVPGGNYIRQAGASFNPYAYGYLHEISDHLHHQESGWAHAGALVLQGDDVPAPYQASLLMGSIHGCSIKRDVLRRNGSTFIASHAPDFLTSGDKNFRPINMRWGPDGSIYVIDWHDQNPCHQAAAGSWDMTHGRIYKIQRTREPKASAVDLSKRSSRELVELLKNNRPWWHRTALRLLRERHDPSIVPDLRAMAFEGDEETRLRALWALHSVAGLDEGMAEKLLRDRSPWLRAWSVRLLCERGQVSVRARQGLIDLAHSETASEVRSQLASSAPRLTEPETTKLLHHLMEHREDASDPNIPLLIWLAYERHVVPQRDELLRWLRDHAPGNALVSNDILPRALRRLAATGKRSDLAACIKFLGELADPASKRKTIEALVQALSHRQVEPPKTWPKVYEELRRDTDLEIQSQALRLAVILGDVDAARQAILLASDTRAQSRQRIDAVRDLTISRPPGACAVLIRLAVQDANPEVRREACRALSAFDESSVPGELIARWGGYAPPMRSEVLSVLASRKQWATELLLALARGKVSRADVSENTILRIRAFRDPKLDGQIEAVWGKFRDTSPDLDKIIRSMRAALFEGRASFERGRQVFDNHCAKCHRFEGRGHDVGPALDGAARDLEYLLANVLDPNRVVGQPYYLRVVALRDGRVETGLFAGEDEHSVTIKGENAVLKVIEKKDIDAMTEHAKSLMPEGLDKNMTVQNFRDLVRYVMANPFLTDVGVTGPFPTDAPKPKFLNESPPTSAAWRYPAVGPPGRIALPESGPGGDKKTYIAAKAISPDRIDTRLQLGAVHPVRAWLNGEAVYSGTPSHRLAEPDQASAEIHLRRGVNRLLFEVRYQGSKELFYARLLDPERKLRYEESRR